MNLHTLAVAVVWQSTIRVSRTQAANLAVLCREILAKFLPHVAGDDERTQILPFYSFAAVQCPISGAAMPAMPAAKQAAIVSSEELYMQPIAEAQ